VNPIEYLRILRRRWPVIAAIVGAALAAAFLTTSVVPVGPAIRSYRATSVILNTGTLNVPGIANLETVAALTTVGDVPVRVAEKINYTGDPVALGARIQALVQPETGLLRITASSSQAEEARTLADTFASELLDFLAERRVDTSAAQIDFLNRRLGKLETEIQVLENRIAEPNTPEPAVRLNTARRDAKIRIYSVISEQYDSLVNAAADPATLVIVQKASPQPVVEGGFQPPRSRAGRMFFAGILGLLVGVGIVLLLERIDTKIRTKRAAEQHFSLPVLAEIPRLSWRDGRRVTVTAAEEPRSALADSFRLLEAGVSRLSLDGERRRVQEEEPAKEATREVTRKSTARPDGSRAILVTSAGPGEGKTLVVANLAATYAELGKRVLVLSCDFRRPRIHRLFGVPNDQGLSEALETGNGRPVLRGHVRSTSLANVRVVPSGATPESAGELLTSKNMRHALVEARQEADIVLLDTPPVLATSDASHLFPEVDTVLLVARAGKTTAEVAERSSELLRRMRAPVVGVALNGSTEEMVPRGYYRSERDMAVGNGMGGFPN
jgi:capsular exopolysaccharide synthesis family protein